MWKEDASRPFRSHPVIYFAEGAVKRTCHEIAISPLRPTTIPHFSHHSPGLHFGEGLLLVHLVPLTEPWMVPTRHQRALEDPRVHYVES